MAFLRIMQSRVDTTHCRRRGEVGYGETGWADKGGSWMSGLSLPPANAYSEIRDPYKDWHVK